jgi:hypothetical protein
MIIDTNVAVFLKKIDYEEIGKNVFHLSKPQCDVYVKITRKKIIFQNADSPDEVLFNKRLDETLWKQFARDLLMYSFAYSSHLLLDRIDSLENIYRAI